MSDGNDGERDVRTGPFRLEEDEWGRLVLELPDGARHVAIAPVRAFPFGDPRRWIALVDEEGRERAMIEDLDILPRALRDGVERELERWSFLPVISAVRRIDPTPPGETWVVETDCGATTFRVEGEDQIRRLGPGRPLVVTDAAGRRYLIRDVNRLDPASRRRIEGYL